MVCFGFGGRYVPDGFEPGEGVNAIGSREPPNVC